MGEPAGFLLDFDPEKPDTCNKPGEYSLPSRAKHAQCVVLEGDLVSEPCTQYVESTSIAGLAAGKRLKATQGR